MSHGTRFGRVEVRPAERLLLIDAQPVPLGSRAFDLLLALVEHRNRVVGKHELLDLVWSGLVVEENNLQVQVSALRKLLGPQAIATIPGRGYRFAMAPDDEAAISAASPSGAPPEASPAAGAAVAPLPVLATTLHGRDDDLTALERLLRQQRLLSIVGAGGIGKTTLALAAAHARQGVHRDGIGWVALADIADPSLVPSAVALAAGLPASGSDDPLPSLVAALAPLQMLLVLDSAEHLLDAVVRLAQAVLAHAPGVQLLVTSQAACKLDGERVFRLGALSVPESGTPAAQALTHGAVALFADQAQAAERHFAVTDANVATVIELCRQLDGMALAIKLAAGRLPLLGLSGLAARLGDRLKLLGGAGRGTPTRQQTVRAALDWSHGLLGAAEKAVFRRLGVFPGGFSLELASAVARDDTLDEWAVIDALGALVDRSLVTMDGNEAPRYRLPQSTREYAWLQLDEAGERLVVQRRHAQALASLMDQAYESYWSAPDKPWLAACAQEIDNVRTALDWGTQHEPALAVRLIGASSFLFLLLGLAPEGRKRCLALEAGPATAEASPEAARYWRERSRLHWGVSNALMGEFALKSVELCRAAGDARGLYLALRCAAGSSAVPAEQASAMLAEMTRLERPDWPPRLRAQRLLAETSVLKGAGRLAETRTALEALLALARQSGIDTTAFAALCALAGVNLSLGDADEALRCSREVISGRGHRRDNFVLQALATMAQALLARGEPGVARDALADFLATSRSHDWEWFGLYADLFALLAAREGRAEAAARLIGHADAACQRVGARDLNMAQARAQACAIVEAALDVPTTTRLMAAGAQMDAEAVCSLTLAGAADTGPA